MIQQKITVILQLNSTHREVENSGQKGSSFTGSLVIGLGEGVISPLFKVQRLTEVQAVWQEEKTAGFGSSNASGRLGAYVTIAHVLLQTNTGTSGQNCHPIGCPNE